MNNKMLYNPNIHHRRSIRLKGYDYSQAGLYFITICCQDRICRFGHIENGEMILNDYGQIAFDEWIKLSERFTNFELDVFQIMPNHMHGIILLNDVSLGAAFNLSQNEIDNQNGINIHNEIARNNILDNCILNNDLDIGIRATARVAPTAAPAVSDIVGAYKSLVANGCLDNWKSKWVGVNPTPMMGKLWQRNYYEHIIRDEKSYETISKYIMNNPAKWAGDKFYLQ